MVLESLFPAKEIISKPREMFIMSFVVSVVSVFSAYFIFQSEAGIIAPLLITAAMTPVIFRIFTIEEEMIRKEAENKIKVSFIERHGETIWLFSLFFLGVLIPFFLISVIMPADFVSATFSQQISEIGRIRGLSADVTGNSISDRFFNVITLNNMKVMGFSFLLSFLFGTGALFILSWNASILAVYLASFMRQGEFTTFFTSTLGIIPHAPVEMLAYFLAGIAGGVLSAGMIREKFGTKEFNGVVKDSLMLLGLGVVSIFAGAYLEVYL